MSTTLQSMRRSPRRQHARKKRFSPARLGVYGFLIIAALFFLLPLYVMLVTSVKPMDEIRLGNLVALPVHTVLSAFSTWLKLGAVVS